MFDAQTRRHIHSAEQINTINCEYNNYTPRKASMQRASQIQSFLNCKNDKTSSFQGGHYLRKDKTNKTLSFFFWHFFPFFFFPSYAAGEAVEHPLGSLSLEKSLPDCGEADQQGSWSMLTVIFPQNWSRLRPLSCCVTNFYYILCHAAQGAVTSLRLLVSPAPLGKPAKMTAQLFYNMHLSSVYWKNTTNKGEFMIDSYLYLSN